MSNAELKTGQVFNSGLVLGSDLSLQEIPSRLRLESAPVIVIIAIYHQ